MQEKIIDFLKAKHDYISGDAISERLGISRQALWKHIQELKDAGYDIVAVPHLGYRLESIPDRLFPSEILHDLPTKIIGRKIYHFDTLASTMETATELALKGAPEGALILAESQTKGKGRLGRDWFSPKHKGIYLSLILRPKLLPNQASLLTLLTAVSICEAVGKIAGITPQIKWPNDILIHHKKVGGILTELSGSMDEVSFVVIGVGINVNNDKKTLISGATSLKEQVKEQLSRVNVLQEILISLEKNYLLLQKKGSDPILEKWRGNSITLNRRVKVYCHKAHVEGEALDIDKDGGLLVRKDSGVIEKVMAGDVVHAR